MYQQNSNFTKKAVYEYFESLQSNYYEEVDLDDFDFNKETRTFYYDCPCGDKFQISLEELEDGEEVATCPSCSLIVKVVYSEIELEKYL